MFKKILLLLLIIGNVPAVAFGGDVYFNKDSIPPALLSPPFAKGSSQQNKELDEIIKLQKKAAEAELVKAQAERNMTAEMVVIPVVPNLTKESYPNVYELLDKVGKTSYGVTDVAKNYWHTDRPYITDGRVKALIEAHNNPAYPSGHTSGSYTWAHVMNMLLPEHGEEFYKVAESIAQHRVLVGMHFPNDVDGGKKLALLIVGGLLQNKQFLEDAHSTVKCNILII